ncbi:hypothetical protein ABZP36_027200 [Zizania latifolia]
MAEGEGLQQHPCCGICMEPMAPTEAHLGGVGCEQAFCSACIAQAGHLKVESGGGTLRCPYASCDGALC